MRIPDATGFARPARKPHGRPDPPPAYETLVRAYATRTLPNAAKQLGVSTARFRHWLEAAGIPVRYSRSRPFSLVPPPPRTRATIQHQRLGKAERAGWLAQGITAARVARAAGLSRHEADRALRGQWLPAGTLIAVRQAVGELVLKQGSLSKPAIEEGPLI